MGQNLRGLPAENERLARAMTLTGFELKEEERFPFISGQSNGQFGTTTVLFDDAILAAVR